MPSSSLPMEEVKKNIRALLISAPRGLSVEDIEHDYRAMLGKPLPYRDFKCRNCLEFLKTLPDVVSPSWSNGSLILRGIADSSTRHIAKLVSRQRTSTRSRRVSRRPICTKPLIVPSYFRSNIKELLLSYPSGVLGSALNSAYARNYGEEINYGRLGFTSMSHLLSCMQDLVTIVKDGRGGFRVCAVRARRRPSTPEALKGQESKRIRALLSIPTQPIYSNNYVSNRRKPTDLTSLEHTETRENEQKLEKSVDNLLDSKSAGVSEDLKEELIAILTERTNGVWAARLPFEYKAKFDKVLSVVSLGYYSVIELASSLPDIIRIQRPFAHGDWMLFLAEKSRKAKNITKIHVPDDAIGKGVCFRSQTLPHSDSIGVYVTYIKSPGCFWIHLEEYGSDLKDLEEKMESFYNSRESAQFLIDDGLVKLGQVCVARFPENNLWYRALITGTPMATQHLAEVFYVDYGNSSQVFKSDLRLMKKTFFELPPRAVKSKLANIKPKKETWDPSAAYRLNEMSADKQLYCWIAEQKDDVLSLCICDTTSNVDIHINDLLVEEGFAVFKNCNTSISNEKTLPQQDSTNTAQSTVSKQNVAPRPPGLASPNARRRDVENQQINVTTPNNNMLSGYSLPLNLFPYTGYGLPEMNHNPTVVDQFFTLPQHEEKQPATVEEEKPSAEDIEFMRQVCEELSDDEVMMVKRLDLPENTLIHLINYQGKPHVIRSEISSLLWGTDLLRSMLRKKKMVVLKEVIAREDHEELFNELKRLKVGDFGEGDELKEEYASLYELSDVSKILEAFKHPSPETIRKIKEEKIAFDANPTSFWTNNSDDSIDTDDSGQSEPEEANLEELKLALQALQFRRKRILRSMMKGEITPGESAVDEVAEVEQQLENIRDLITKAEAKETCSKESEACPKRKENKENDENKVENKVAPVTAEETPANEVKLPKQEDPCVKHVGITLPSSKTLPPISKDPPAQTKQQAEEMPPNNNNIQTLDNLAVFIKNQEQHYRSVVETAKQSIETLSLTNSPLAAVTSTNLTRGVSSVHVSSSREPPVQDFNQMQPTYHGLLAAPAGMPTYIGAMPHPNLFFHHNNAAPPFNGFVRQLVRPISPQALPDMPPGGPYHQQGFVGHPPIYFPWNQQNTFAARPFYGGNVRERPSHS